MKNKKKRKSDIFLVLIIIIGLSVMLYPAFSNYWNNRKISEAISAYDEKVESIDESEKDKLISEAKKYNAQLAGNFSIHYFEGDERERYNSVLDITGTGIMGYIEIPSIDVKLPVYHGVDESVLQVAAGHIEWSSLPVGGATAHCVISGHRGLPRAKLFTDLDALTEGDNFVIRVLNQTFWYQVDKITIVEPDELENLTMTEGMDYVTLLTCTPYGINTHRLLVRGHRITGKSLDLALRVTADAAVISPVIPAAVIFTLIVVLIIFAPVKKRKKHTYKIAEEK